MKVLVLAFLFCLASVGPLAAFAVPSSPRSREAIARVTPALERALAAKGLTLGAPIFIRIFKESREFEVWVAAGGTFKLFKTYDICSYSGDPGPKLCTGDGQSPEGFYYVTPERMNPVSHFHLSFNLGFPNAYDRAHGRTGSALMVHGNCVSIGCYAMTDPVIEEIFTLADAAFRGGQPFFRVHIFPFRMTDGNMTAQRQSPWAGFWANLKEGYGWFEQNHRPPNVTVAGGRYIFSES